LGQTIYNFERDEEQREMMRQIVEIVGKEKPDAFLLCGDVYHTPQPSAAVQTLFTDALVEIHNANPGMTIVITAGNHDSGTRHEIFRTPWKALNVNVIGNLDKDSADEHIIQIPARGYIVAIPYVHERNIPDGYFQQLLDTVKERNTEGLPVVMMAHTTVRGCDFSGHDHSSEYSVGGIDSIDIEEMGEGYDYLALGHIHHAQFVHSGKHNVRYSGSPLAVSFDENYAHSVSIVQIDRHGAEPAVRKLEIINPRPLVTLPVEGMATWEEAKAILKKFPDDIPAYIRLNVEIEDFLPVGANAEAYDLTKGKQCRFCYVNAKRKMARQAEERVFTVQEFKEENPIDIARRFAEDSGIPFDDTMTELFKEVLDMIKITEQ